MAVEFFEKPFVSPVYRLFLDPTPDACRHWRTQWCCPPVNRRVG
jgi:hypothetical protein